MIFRGFSIVCSIFLFFAIISFYCSGLNGNLAGGVETTNGIIITVHADYIHGVTSPGSQIILCDTSFLPPQFNTISFIDTFYTDENGQFSTSSLTNGTYNLIARNETLDSGAIIRNIRVNNSKLSKYTDSSKYYTLGLVFGNTLVDSLISSSCLIYIRGTVFWDTTDTNGNFTIPKIPHGYHKIEAYQKGRKGVDTIIYTAFKDSVRISNSDISVQLNLNLKQEN